MNRPPNNVLIAFSIHLFTASGAFLAFLSIVAAGEGRFVSMWFWLGIALLVDGVDGPLARHFDVKNVLPNWSGETLDNIIDYVTFAMIPAFALYQMGMLQEYASFMSAALIVCTSAIYYADTRMKSRDNCFIGFPICWNMVVFTLYVLQPNWYVAASVVALSALLTFIPWLYVHPVRVRIWRPFTLGMLALWAACGATALANQYFGYPVPLLAIIGITVSGIYLYCVGFVLQILGKAA